MSTPDQSLQALLANLRPRSQASTSQYDGTNPSRDATMTFSSTTALPATPPPPFSPPISTGNAAQSNATAQSLLNLLNFGNSSSSSPQFVRSTSASAAHESASRPNQESVFTAADLLRQTTATNSDTTRSAPEQQQPVDTPDVSSPSAMTTKPPSTSGPSPIGAPRPQSSTSNQEAQKPLFTYKNPFEALRASRPHTPRTQLHPVTEAQLQQNPQEQDEAHNEALTHTQGHERDHEPVQSIEETPNQDASASTILDRAKLTPKSRAPQQKSPVPLSGPDHELQVGDEDLNTQDEAMNAPSSEPPAYAISPTVPVETTHPDPLRSPEPVHDTGGEPQPSNGASGRIVPVLNFPVKAFVSITLQLKAPAPSRVREEGVMEISRLKKEFDQIDRSLAAASSKYITYALVKNGGMRIIRQDDGKDRQIFKHTHDRIFNVSVCTTSVTTPPAEHQAVLGTGISGTVYYATVCKPNLDLFDANELERESLIFPAFPQADENTAGGVLKTRAKRSSRHPDFFAIGRGKAIHIVWPAAAMNANYGITEDQRKVDVEKFFQERSLQILTGKAGKDFTFSDDDTMIVSLDKTGRLRFWDVRKLIDEDNARSVHITPYVIDTPVLSLATAAPAEKSWPTSVHFVDKARPYLRGGALRYVLVGLRQNHTLQLWDIALGKAVQEVNFPHESETDGICSVNYHPATGIIAVGHPTRNSIFFIHLSAPRYALSPSLSQASFVQRVAAKDPDIPKPDSTACMSGIREISFEGRGQLRSVELLPVHKQDNNIQTEMNDALFELYVAHSTGVTCLAINKEDLGWDADSKIVKGIDAENQGLVSLRDLKLGSVIDENSRNKSPTQEPPPYSKSDKKKKPKKSKEAAEEAVNGTEETLPDKAESAVAIENDRQEAANTETTILDPTSSSTSKKTKKKKETLGDSAVSQKQDGARKSDVALPSAEISSGPRRALSPQPPQEQLSMSISGDWLDKEMRKLEKAVNSEFKKELEQLYQTIKSDRTAQDQLSNSRQEAVLRVVSTTLNTNVEKTLNQILRAQMQEVVVPSVVQAVSTDISQQVTEMLSQLVKIELGSELPGQIDRTLQSPQMLARIADNVALRINGQIEKEIDNTINTTVAASMKNIAANTAVDAVAAAEGRIADQVAHMSRQHALFNEKIESLNSALQSVASTLQGIMQNQATFQAQVLQDLRSTRSQEYSHSQPVHAVSATFSPSPSTRATPARQRSKAELELEEVATLMGQRKYEEGSIKWLQSSQPSKLFDELFVRFTPDYLATDVTPLVAFSIGVTVANNLSTNTQQRLEWIGAAFSTVDFKDREILELRQHAPQLLDTLIQRLEALDPQHVDMKPNDMGWRMIPPLLKTAAELKAAFESISMGKNVPGLGLVSGSARGIID